MRKLKHCIAGNRAEGSVNLPLRGKCCDRDCFSFRALKSVTALIAWTWVQGQRQKEHPETRPGEVSHVGQSAAPSMWDGGPGPAAPYCTGGRGAGGATPHSWASPRACPGAAEWGALLFPGPVHPAACSRSSTEVEGTSVSCYYSNLTMHVPVALSLHVHLQIKGKALGQRHMHQDHHQLALHTGSTYLHAHQWCKCPLTFPFCACDSWNFACHCRFHLSSFI